MDDVLKTAIDDVLQELGFGEVAFSLEHPENLAFGDYATNAPMVAAKEAGKSPREIAELIKTKLEGQIEYVEKIEVAGPGFLNFTLVRDFFTQEVVRAQQAGDRWGSNDILAGKKVIVEYTDPNPFKELHIGHLVPNALGESLARLCMFAGAETKRVTFQGDVGMHVAKAVWGLQKNGNTVAAGFDAQALGKAYATGATAFEESEEVKAEITALNKKLYTREDESLNALYDYGKSVSLAYFEIGYALLGSQFDRNFFESVTGPVGLALVKTHIGDIFTESEGAVIFKGEDYGLHTRVFVNKEGLPTYETKDVGLIACKHEWFPFDLAITVTGTEQQEYFKVTKKASELIQPDLAGKVELVPNGMLRLKEGKMSSRTGNVITALSFIDEIKQEALIRMEESGVANPQEVANDIAVGALKYTILKIGSGKDIVFDLKNSVSFEGNSGPYLQYTCARIGSAVVKAQSLGIEASYAHAPEVPYTVERLLYRFPSVAARALQEREPHYVATFITELAGAFNSFYGQEKIADTTDEFAPYKVLVASAVQQTIKNGLWLLGIKSPGRL